MKRISVWRGVKRTFLTGLFIVAPISLTFILLSWFVSLIDHMITPFTGDLPIPGLGLLAAVAIVLAAGVLGSNILGQQLLEWAEELLLRIPGLNWVYRTIKQLSEVFSPAGRANFKSAVLVEYPRPGVWSLGFATNEVKVDDETLMAVYVPTNHLYIGDIILVPAASVRHTHLGQQEGIQAVISAGASLSAEIKTHRKS